MNDRIKQLAEQAEISRLEYNSATMMTERIQEFDKAKFAELIVQECAQLARNTNLEDVEGGDSAVLLAAKHHILDHFGVEE